jgi:long-chain acyl-CoA synthetase
MAGRMFDLTNPFEEAEIAAARAVAAEAHPDTAPRPMTLFPILFTSGTTGRVKGAVLTHRNLITGLISMQLSGVHGAAQHGRQIWAWSRAKRMMAHMPQQAVLLVYPLFHISGLGCLPLAAIGGIESGHHAPLGCAGGGALIADEKITMFTGVPTMLWDLLHRAKLGDADLVSLRNIAAAGRPCRSTCLTKFARLSAGGDGHRLWHDRMLGRDCPGRGRGFHPQPFVGRTRAAAGRGSHRSAGRRGPADRRSGRDPGARRAWSWGYWNRPEDTAAAFTADGWLRTGDVGYVDEEGYVFIVDRKKDMVISGGENIYCAEVERVMGEMPGVTECAAFGIPTSGWANCWWPWSGRRA